jgi:hypothetical protein
MHPLKLHRYLPVARRRKQGHARLIGASFASSFRTVAKPTNAALDIYGFECLIDRQGISGGEDWKRSAHQRACEDPNYIFFHADPKAPDSAFGTGLAKLVATLNTDFDWLREHTRYLQRATEWDAGGRPENRLLSGNDIPRGQGLGGASA